MAKGVDFDQLVTCHYGPLYQFAISLTRDEAEACDLTQQTFCIWAAKGHQLRDLTKVKTWLFTTLHREFLGSRRRQTRFPHVELEQASFELPAVSPATIYQLDSAQLLETVSQLDEIYRAPVVLFYLEDYSYDEIARILNIPLGTVKSRLARGLQRLHLFTDEHSITAIIVNRDEIKQILLLYRPGTSDALDPEIAEALVLAQSDAELSGWLEEHCARQKALREKFRQIALPAALKEQILSEQAAKERAFAKRQKVMGISAAAGIVFSVIILGIFYMPQRTPEAKPEPPTLANYETHMAIAAASNYYMNLQTNDAGQIQAYLAQNQAPADYSLPAGLAKVTVTGCAIEGWQDSKASMICFRTKPLPHGQLGDLWLFVIDRSAVKDISTISPASPQFTEVNGLMTAAWTQNDKLYLLSIKGDEAALKKYL